MTATRRRRGASPGPMPSHYSAFGLNLACNDAIAGLVPNPASAVTHVRIWFDTAGARFETERVSVDPWYVSETDCRAVPALRVWKIAGGRFYKWSYGDGTEFIVDGSGTRNLGHMACVIDARRYLHLPARTDSRLRVAAARDHMSARQRCERRRPRADFRRPANGWQVHTGRRVRTARLPCSLRRRRGAR